MQTFLPSYKTQNDLDFDDCFILFPISEVNVVQEGFFYNHVNKYWIVKDNSILRKRVGSFLFHKDFRVLTMMMDEAPELFKDCEIRLIPFIFLRQYL